MDAEELEKHCAALSIDGGVPTLNIKIENHRESVLEVCHCLVGRILSRKWVNREAFKAVITKIWNTMGDVEIEMVGENMFQLYFNRRDDRSMVWSRGPWYFNNCLLVLEKPSGPKEIMKLQFRWVEFWVQIFNIPLMCMNMKVARMTAEMIGVVIEIPMEDKECWGKFFRDKVALDVSQPLIKGLILNLEEFSIAIGAPIRYERLPEFCYGCGRIGHSLRECQDEDIRAKAIEGRGADFGADEDWDCASDKRRREKHVISSRGVEPIKAIDPSTAMVGPANDIDFFSEVRVDSELSLIREVSGGSNQHIMEDTRPVITCEKEVEMIVTMEGVENVVGDDNKGDTSKGKGMCPPKLNVRKWRRAARLASSLKGRVSQPSPFQGIQLACKVVEDESEGPFKQISPASELILDNLSRRKRQALTIEDVREDKKCRIETCDILVTEAGMGNPRTLAALKRVIWRFSPELVFLCETKVKGDIATRFKFQLGHIDVRIKREGEPHWRFSGFYGNPNHNDRRDLWELLRRLNRVDDLPWVWVGGGGDFNEILCVDDKLGGSEKSVMDLCNFRNVVDECDLIDLGFTGPRITWNNRRDGVANVQERLDRILANCKWIDLFPGAKIQHLGFNSLDHCPLLVVFGEGSRGVNAKGKRAFKFEPFWLKEEECMSVVREAWNIGGLACSLEDIKGKLLVCALRLEGWSLIKFGFLKKAISSLQKEVEVLLIQAQIRGDRNSKFFHAQASARKKKNTIALLKNEYGRTYTLIDGITNTVHLYFSSLFNSTNPSMEDIERSIEGVDSRVNL
ncbi:hypothetical protein EZV62_011071 [Acer yangbiense]|uniref:CCHC-type domain-containing protein n=1 Tax=Acer yangbiense TaxID=1000413 RepID=A0A5C7I485_9ROSI|nr:hypothetical protein EZV62_011071 [Acer yangbiense]